MAVKSVFPLAQLYLLLWCSVEFTKGQGDVGGTFYAGSDTDDVVLSKVKVPMCCPQIDLNLPHEQDCESLRTSKSNVIMSPKDWTFPRHMMAENVSTKFQ